jgi:hypothetical protein
MSADERVTAGLSQAIAGMGMSLPHSQDLRLSGWRRPTLQSNSNPRLCFSWEEEVSTLRANALEPQEKRPTVTSLFLLLAQAEVEGEEQDGEVGSAHDPPPVHLAAPSDCGRA